MLLPQQIAAKQIPLSTTDIQKEIWSILLQSLKDKSFLKKQSALSLLVESISVAFPIRSAVQVNTHVCAVLNHLSLFSQDGNIVCLVPDLPKIQNISVVLFTFKIS